MGLHRVHLLSWMTIWQKDQKKSCKRNRLQDFFVAPRVGLEPTTARLTAACSTDWAIEDYNKNTVLSLDYVSGTFLVPSKLHIVSFIHKVELVLGIPASSLPLRGVIIFPLRCLMPSFLRSDVTAFSRSFISETPLQRRLRLFAGSFINSLRSFISCLFPLRCLSALSTSHWKFFSWLLSFADRRLRSFLVKPSTY